VRYLFLVYAHKILKDASSSHQAFYFLLFETRSLKFGELLFPFLVIMRTPSSASPATFDITPSTLLQCAEITANRLRRGVTHLVESVSPQQATFENAIRPLAEIDNEVKSSVQYTALFQAVSPSPELRKASSAAISIIDKAYLALFQHEGLFALVGAAHGNYSRSRDDIIDEEDRRLLDRFHRMFVDNGIELAGSARERYIWISRRLIDLRVAFMENLSNDPGYVWKAEHELEGVPLDTLELDKDYPSAVFRISLAKPSVNSILVNCHNADTRAEIFLKSQTLYQEKNVPVFREIITLRDEAARLLGFPSFATQKLRQQLVKSPDRVCSLLDQLNLALQPIAQQELQALHKVLAKPRLSDFDFQHNQILKKKYHVDQELVAEYFPAQVTIRRMLNIFETLFALAIIELDNLAEICKWHPDVIVYEVWEADKSVFVGYLYIDIYPRPGKYNHAANFNIYPVSRPQP
jgi:metallopeptidase MepB